MEVDPDDHKIVNPSETTRLVTDDNDFHTIERYDEQAAPRQITSTDLDVLYTFWIMKARQWERIHKGSYRNPQSFSKLWLFFFLGVYAAYLCLQIIVFRRTRDWILEFILMGMLSVTMSILVSRVIWFYKLMLLEAYTYVVIFFILDLYYQPAKYIPIGIATVGAIIVTFLVYIVYPYIFHCYIECTGSVTPKIGNTKDGVCMEDNARIEFEQGNCYSKSVQCVYQGPVRDGKPHGMGVWIDTSLQGEFLQGWWEEGIPRGPFESMENGTRSLLVNLRIFFACDAGGKFWLERIPLTYGVASVECCVSGNFFKSYPRVEVISGPEECKCPHKKCTCVGTMLKGKQYRHIDDEKHLKSVVVNVEKRGITITGHKPQKEFHDKVTISATMEKDSPKLVLDEEWLSSTTTEALLFIHGYDHNLDDALKRFGQFLALGHFPSYLKPFVFNWPSSTNPLFYWCAHSVASDNDTHRDLKKFIYSLRAAGIKTLHIMCHSMGTRFLLRSWASVKSLFDVRFTSPHSSYTDLDRIESQSAPGIQLQNLIFLNPDYEMTTFKNDYEELRPYCSRITIYADNRDSAIRLAFKMTNKVSLGSPVNPLIDRHGKFLDIDLIDTSDLDRNTNSTFHSFFNINRLMVDDLWELIVTTKRATERTSRLKRWGHVYRFSILPSSVVMV